jgi:hypothetical protein
VALPTPAKRTSGQETVRDEKAKYFNLLWIKSAAEANSGYQTYHYYENQFFGKIRR